MPVDQQTSNMAVFADFQTLTSVRSATFQSQTFAMPAGLAARGGAIAADLRHGAEDQPISAALLAESAREEEARLAQAAAEGRFGESRMGEVFTSDFMSSVTARLRRFMA